VARERSELAHGLDRAERVKGGGDVAVISSTYRRFGQRGEGGVATERSELAHGLDRAERLPRLKTLVPLAGSGFKGPSSPNQALEPSPIDPGDPIYPWFFRRGCVF
jgi:hypothetical protein